MCCENHTKNKNTLCGQNGEFFCLAPLRSEMLNQAMTSHIPSESLFTDSFIILEVDSASWNDQMMKRQCLLTVS
jgi:hypothetical protein